MALDFVIAGGGIGGTVLATLLGRQGLRVRVLERATGPPPFVRPEVLWPVTVEFLGNHGFTDSYLHTASGDVTVCFANSMPVTVHANSDMASGHGIITDFPSLNISQQGGVFSPRSMSAEGAINGGGPALRIRTTIGQIAFHRCQ